MNPPPAYSIRSLIHSYEGRIVLDIPQLDIPSGYICAFVGPNGCGKSTLLSILSMLLTPAAGSVLLHGEESVGNRDRALRRKVTLVHQRPVLFSMTVRHNIAYGLHALGLHSKEIRHRVHAIIERMKLAEIADKPARKLSGGEAQRAVLARALVLETPVILLDEPTNSLDDASKPILRDLLLQMSEKRGVTVVLATHAMNFVASLTDRIVRLEEGKILEKCGF
ncbi:MAG: ATP-binding cassette domain-containing protein [Acidobacteria bacterium]|nr:ATP-binding cassette domain-containing protein [Acidobacteriota bacterium]